MLNVFFITILVAQVSHTADPNYLFELFNRLYFTPGLQFEINDPSYKNVWLEGRLQLTTPIVCNKSDDGLRKDCHISLLTGTINFLSAPEFDDLQMKNCKASMTVSEFDLGSSYFLNITSAVITSCDPGRASFEFMSDRFQEKASHFNYTVDKYIDSYPIQPAKDEAMRHIIGYAMHAQGREII